MARARAKKDLLTRLADAGEDTISRLHDAPGADRLLGVANSMRDRVDELQKKVRGIDELEKRIAVLEKRVEELSGGPKRRRAPAKRTTAKATTRARKPRASEPAEGSTDRAGGASPG
jgi:TolA-binding protein